MIIDFWIEKLIKGEKTLSDIAEPRKSEVIDTLNKYLAERKISQEDYNRIMES